MTGNGLCDGLFEAQDSATLANAVCMNHVESYQQEGVLDIPRTLQGGYNLAQHVPHSGPQACQAYR